MGTIHAFRSSLATLFLLGHCRYVQRRLERLSWSMLRGKQVLPEGTARLGSRNMKACPTYTCVSWTWGWDCSCAGCCPTAPVTIPMCCGVKSRNPAQELLPGWVCEGHSHLAAHRMHLAPGLSLSWGFEQAKEDAEMSLQRQAGRIVLACGVTSARRIQTSRGLIRNSTCEIYLGTCII